jgi:hypothetical protein
MAFFRPPDLIGILPDAGPPAKAGERFFSNFDRIALAGCAFSGK